MIFHHHVYYTTFLDRRISPILKLGFLIAFSGFLYFNELLDTDFVIFHTRIFEYLYLEWKYVFFVTPVFYQRSMDIL